MKMLWSIIIIFIGINLAFCQTGYVVALHQPTENENCSLNGVPSCNYTFFTLKQESGAGTLINFGVNGTTEQGKRIAAYALTAFLNGNRVFISPGASLPVVCGANNIIGYYGVVYMDLLKN